MGDILSLAGKVITEQSYPCVRVAWEGGREPCNAEGVVEGGPPGSLESMAALQPFLNRYGLTPEEMAILVAGSHGTRGAGSKTSAVNPSFPSQIQLLKFGSDNSGVDWIQKASKRKWIVTPRIEFDNNVIPLGYIERLDSILNESGGSINFRLASDMMFFPSAIENNAIGFGNAPPDQEAKPVEAYLVRLSNEQFFVDYAKAFTKMYVDNSDLGCE